MRALASTTRAPLVLRLCSLPRPTGPANECHLRRCAFLCEASPALMAQQGQLVASTLDWLDNNSKWLAAVAFLQSLRSLPGPDATWSALGVVLTSYLSKGLKVVVQEPRPAKSPKRDMHGMPSSHATAVAYVAAYTSLCKQRQAWSTIGAAVLLVVAGAALGSACAGAWRLWGQVQGIPALVRRPVVRRAVKVCVALAFTRFFAKIVTSRRRKGKQHRALHLQ